MGRGEGRTVSYNGRPMDAAAVFERLGLTGAAYAAPVAGGPGAGFREDDLVTPASVMKIQVALTVESSIAAGSVDGCSYRRMRREDRTPGPVGISLMHDDVSMSVRDLVVAMLTVSDNAATDELIAVVGLDEINANTRRLGMARTLIASDMRGMLNQLARDVGFPDYAALAGHDPETDGPPSEDEVRRRVADSAALDPDLGTRTTAMETVRLLQAIWTDRGGPQRACTAVRRTMGQQLTRHRIAAGFAPPVTVAAKSGGLMGIIRNEAGVVTFPDGAAYAVAVFTRRKRTGTNPARIDAGIGTVARLLVDKLRRRGFAR